MFLIFLQAEQSDPQTAYLLWSSQQDVYKRQEEYSFTDTVKAGIYEDLSIDFSEINIL